jgi:hypothetical protein
MRPRVEYTGSGGCVIVDGIALVSDTWTMTAQVPDAQDATQEILIRVISRLSPYRGDAACVGASGIGDAWRPWSCRPSHASPPGTVLPTSPTGRGP